MTTNYYDAKMFIINIYYVYLRKHIYETEIHQFNYPKRIRKKHY
jgi:hypothetical protein